MADEQRVSPDYPDRSATSSARTTGVVACDQRRRQRLSSRRSHQQGGQSCTAGATGGIGLPNSSIDESQCELQRQCREVLGAARGGDVDSRPNAMGRRPRVRLLGTHGHQRF